MSEPQKLDQALEGVLGRIGKAVEQQARAVAPTPQQEGFRIASLAAAGREKRAEESRQFVKLARSFGFDADLLKKIDQAAEVHVVARDRERFIMVNTGEIMLTRAEIAERLDDLPRHVSSLMGELASINAIERRKQGREVKYFLNPHIATHLPGASAREAARDAAGPLLTLMEGGKTD